MRIRTRMLLITMGAVLLSVGVLVGVGAWQSAEFSRSAQVEVDKLVQRDLDHITEGVYNVVKTQDDAVQQKVDYDLNVARHILNAAGAVQLADAAESWTAVNQYTQASTTIQLPRMMVGDTWLGHNADMGVETPIVDHVQNLVGGTATIFQRMNAAGDFLRVATNVEKTDGTRAIGTYIPAVNPDGAPNPVISTVLRGRHTGAAPTWSMPGMSRHTSRSWTRPARSLAFSMSA